MIRILNKLYRKVIKQHILKVENLWFNRNYPKKVEKLLNRQDVVEWRETEERKTNIIVSLTTLPKRIDTVYLIIECIMVQTLKPDKIILCLVKSEYPDNFIIPESLSNLEGKRFEILWVNENLKPHNKYFYTMNIYPESIVITVDDDCFVKRKLVEELYNASKRFPGCVVCTRAHKLRFSKDGVLLPYMQWEYETLICNRPGLEYLATGVGGVLYPPRILPECAFDKTRIKELCLCQDDIWLKAMEILKNVNVVVVKAWKSYVIGIYGVEDEVNLMNQNVQGGRNDYSIKAVFDAYNIWKLIKNRVDN